MDALASLLTSNSPALNGALPKKITSTVKSSLLQVSNLKIYTGEERPFAYRYRLE